MASTCGNWNRRGKRRCSFLSQAALVSSDRHFAFGSLIILSSGTPLTACYGASGQWWKGKPLDMSQASLDRREGRVSESGSVCPCY